jgi:hypothetical protein
MAEDDFLNYRIIVEGGVCIVVFTGVFSNKFQNSFEECYSQLRESKSKMFILKFGDVTRFERLSHRFLIRLQHLIRNDLKADVRICEIRPLLRTELLDTGIIKSVEYYDNLRNALVGPKE